jgi:periplasmic protein TonB
MHASTVVTRTGAGSAELAAPAHGLSLTQRRFLTLLDTSVTVEQLAARHHADPDKLARDLTRLASLGLVTCEMPAANDATAPLASAGNVVRVDGVRLGAPGASRRLPLVLAAIAVVLVAWAVWQAFAAHKAPGAPPPLATSVQDTPSSDSVPEQIDPIATKVLKSDPNASSARDAKDAGAPRGASRSERQKPDTAASSGREVKHPETAHESAPPVLPVERRSPAPAEPATTPGAMPAATTGDLPAGLSPAEPGTPPVPTPTASPTATPSSKPAISAADSKPAVLPVHPPASSPPHAADARFAEPVRVASAATPAGLLASAPAKLVPISQDAPAFPREALALGLANGNVKARLTIDAKGNVSSVEVVAASHRAFDRAVRDALARWRFDPGSSGRTTIVDVAFRRD